MNGHLPRFWPIFFELYESLPRQRPGNRACAERALDLCRELPPAPAILDLGCGVGGQTIHLTELTSGSIVYSAGMEMSKFDTKTGQMIKQHEIIEIWPE